MPVWIQMPLLPRKAIGLALALIANLAHAQPSDESRARADTLFREGQELMSAGQLPTACAKLEESQRLDPKLGRLLNVAYCHEQLGRTAAAWGEYNQAAALASQTQQSERETFARKQASRLAGKLAFVQLDLVAAPDVSQVSVDGSSLTRDQWTVPFPIDPGEHTLTFRAPGRQTRTLSVTITATGTSRVAVEPLEQEVPAPPPPTATASPVSPSATTAPAMPEPPRDQPSPPSASGTPTIGWIVGGIGTVALGVGTAFGVRAMSLRSDADPQCSNHLCTPRGTSLIDDAKGAATVSTVGLAVGVVGVGVGGWLVLRASSRKGVRAEIAPVVAADRAGVTLLGAW